ARSKQSFFRPPPAQFCQKHTRSPIKSLPNEQYPKTDSAERFQAVRHGHHGDRFWCGNRNHPARKPVRFLRGILYYAGEGWKLPDLLRPAGGLASSVFCLWSLCFATALSPGG